MPKLVHILTALAVATIVGCAASGPTGGFYQATTDPVSFHTGQTTNIGADTIEGEACATSYLGVFASGDWSVAAALSNAGAEGKTLKNVAVDRKVTSYVFGAYAQYCTRVSAQVAM